MKASIVANSQAHVFRKTTGMLSPSEAFRALSWLRGMWTPALDTVIWGHLEVRRFHLGRQVQMIFSCVDWAEVFIQYFSLVVGVRCDPSISYKDTDSTCVFPCALEVSPEAFVASAVFPEQCVRVVPVGCLEGTIRSLDNIPDLALIHDSMVAAPHRIQYQTPFLNEAKTWSCDYMDVYNVLPVDEFPLYLMALSSLRGRSPFVKWWSL